VVLLLFSNTILLPTGFTDLVLHKVYFVKGAAVIEEKE
jgi:hypothetical protein